MKKALSLLAVSLFICTVMILGASAAITGDGYVAWDFTNESDVAEWVPSDSTTLETTFTGTELSGAGNDLRINNKTTAVSLIDELSDYPYVVFRYRNVVNGGGSLQFYHWTSNQSGAKYLASTLTSGTHNQVLTKVIDASTVGTWAGKPSELRIDPFRGEPQRSVELIDVCLAKDEATYNQYLVDLAAKRLANTVLEEFEDDEFGAADIADFVDEYYNDFYTETFGYSVNITVPDRTLVYTSAQYAPKGYEANHQDGTFGFDVTVTDAANAYKFEGLVTTVTEKTYARPVVWDFSNERDAAAWTFTASETFTSNRKVNGVEYYNEKGTLLDIYFDTTFTDRYNLEDYNYFVLTYTLPANGNNVNAAMSCYYGAPNESFKIASTTIAANGIQKIKMVLNKTDERWNGYQKFRLSPNRSGSPTTITLHDLGLYRDEADYINYSVNNALTRLENLTFPGADEETIEEDIEYTAEAYSTLFDPDTTVTVDTTNAVYVAPIDGTAGDPDGTNGSYTFEATATQGDVSVTREITVIIPCDKENIILNFDNPVMLDALGVKDGRAGVSLVSAQDAQAGDFKILGENVMKIEKIENDLAGHRTELNIRLDLLNSVYPEISDLSDYPYLVYSYKIPELGGTYQVYYYTDGYTAGHAYQQFTSGHMDEGYSYGSWGFKTLNPTRSHLATGAGTQNTSVYDYSWNGKASSIRFDFGKNTTQYPADEEKGWAAVTGIPVGYTVYLDYVGLFRNESEAEAFKANPTLDTTITPAELKEKYAHVFEAADYIDAYYIDEEYESNDQAIAHIRELMAGEGIDEEDYYIVIDDVEISTDANIENPELSNDVVKFRIICADSINNGNYASSDSLNLFFRPSYKFFDISSVGVQYRADGAPGLRYGVKVKYNDYIKQPLKIEGAENVTFGVLVMPNEIYANIPSALTHDNLVATDIENVYTIDDVEKVVADVKAVNVFESNNEYFIYTAVITDIPADADLEMLFVPYVKYDYEGQTIYYYPIDSYVAPVNYTDVEWYY